MRFEFLVFLYALISTANGYKILFLVPISGKSHWVYLEHFVRALLDRKHEVTCITNFALEGPRPENYTEILIDPPFDLESVAPQEEIFTTMVHQSIFSTLKLYINFGNFSADYALSSKNVQNFIHRNDLHFDLVINEELFHDSFLMFGHEFKAPIITIGPYGVRDLLDRQMGLLTPYSHVPHTLLTYTDKMTFTERWYNTIVSLYDWILYRYVHISNQNEIAKKHFSHLGPLPSIDDMIKNVSLIIINAHRSITPPKPSMPGLIYIGGAHIQKPKPLSNDLQSFMDNATDGVIYFSLGTVLKSSKMPKDKLKIFLEAFRSLKQRIIWKFEDESLDVPPNMLVRKWLPQNDILAHPNVVLIISHGGMFTNFEAISYGIPMLMIPFLADQFRNALRVETAGYGKYIHFKEITKESMVYDIKEMIENKSYRNKVREISAQYSDNLVHPMDEAMFWIEYVCRHKGAKHLKSHAINMSWFSYLLLDVLLATILSILLVVFSVYFLCMRFCGRNNSKSDKIKKRD